MPDIAFWNKCDNKCVMCTNTPGFARQDPAGYGLRSQIVKMEKYLRGQGRVYPKNADKADFVSLTGGEPTLHPEFFKLLAYFRRRLPAVNITLLSNGRRFADKEFTSRFLKLAVPPFSVAVALHASKAPAHDAITGVRGSFARTVEGLENLFALARGQEVEIRLVLHRRNIKELPALLKFLLKKFPDTARYAVTAIHYEIEGMSAANHESLGLKLSDSARVLNGEAELLSGFADFRLYHFPLCLVGKALRPLCRITLPEEDRIYTARCRACAARKKCLGLMLEYYKKFGDGELARIPARAV